MPREKYQPTPQPDSPAPASAPQAASDAIWDDELTHPCYASDELERLKALDLKFSVRVLSLPEIERQKQFALGRYSWCLQPGADPAALIAAALDGRSNTPAVLLKLYSVIRTHNLTSGPLYQETKRILQEQGLIPADVRQTARDILAGRV